MKILEFRSDTFTLPTVAMRTAMADAKVGDDVFGDDPTAIALEARAAELLSKEAGLFVPSGAMGNLVSLMAHLARGQEAIAGEQAHLVIDEAAGHAVVVGASIRTIREQPDGSLDLDTIRNAFRDPTDPHEPITGLITIENTVAHAMGQPLTPTYTAAVGAVARERGVPLHIDGARFWNAVVALDVSPKELAGPADSVSFCLSKALACPIGSVVVGSKDFIWRARRARKLLGGGMRQVGVIAAPGLIALRDGPAGMIERLAEDHANARRLAEALAEQPEIQSAGDIAQPEPGPLDPGRVRTNFVVFKVDRDRTAFLDALAREGVLMVAYPHGQVRAVTHYGVDADDIETTIGAVRRALASTSGTWAGAEAGTKTRGAERAGTDTAAAAGTDTAAAAVAR